MSAITESDLVALLPGVYYMDLPDGGSVTILEQLQLMSEDAARWRYLQEQHQINDDDASNDNYGKDYPPRTLVVFGPAGNDMIEPISCMPGILMSTIDRMRGKK